MRVWTGAGYEELPTYQESDFGMINKPIYGMYSSGDGESYGEIGSEQVWGMTPEAQAKYGKLFGLGQENNWRMTGTPSGERGALEFMLKSGEKEGTNVRYTLQNGQYVPEVVGSQRWDSNSNQGMAAAAMAAVAGGGLLAAGMGGGGAAAAGAGSGATAGGELAGLMGQGLGGGATSGGAFGGMTAGGSLGGMTGGAGSLVPASLSGSLGSGFASGLGGLGSLTPTASTLSAWNSLAPSITGAAGGGSAGTDFLGKAGDFLKNNPSALSNLAKVGGMLAGGAAGVNGQAQSPQQSIQQPVPKMYGGDGSSGLLGWGPMGSTETEKRMRTQYLPGLLGGQNPWGY